MPEFCQRDPGEERRSLARHDCCQKGDGGVAPTPLAAAGRREGPGVSLRGEAGRTSRPCVVPGLAYLGLI